MPKAQKKHGTVLSKEEKLINKEKVVLTSITSLQKKKDTGREQLSSYSNSTRNMASLRRARSWWIFVQHQDLGARLRPS